MVIQVFNFSPKVCFAPKIQCWMVMNLTVASFPVDISI